MVYHEILLLIYGFLVGIAAVACVFTLTDREALRAAAHRVAFERDQVWRRLQRQYAPVETRLPATYEHIVAETHRERRRCHRRGPRAVPHPVPPDDLTSVPPIHLYRLASVREFAAATVEGWWARNGDDWTLERPVANQERPYVVRIEANRAATAGVRFVREGGAWRSGDVPVEFVDWEWSVNALRARFR